jgi:hypothetical protein
MDRMMETLITTFLLAVIAGALVAITIILASLKATFESALFSIENLGVNLHNMMLSQRSINSSLGTIHEDLAKIHQVELPILQKGIADLIRAIDEATQPFSLLGPGSKN